MIRIYAAAAITALAAAVSVQALAADAITRRLGWDGAPSLSISIPGTVTFSQGPTVSMVVSGPRDMVERVYLQGDQLRYRHSSSWFNWRTSQGLKVTISAPHLNNVSAQAGTNLNILNLTEDALSLSAHSGSDVHARTNVRSMSVRVHSGADVTAVGQAERLALTVHSGSGANFADLKADHVDVSAHSGADATVNPRLSAKLSAHSGGDIRLVSRPERLDTSRHSGGGIRVP